MKMLLILFPLTGVSVYSALEYINYSQNNWTAAPLSLFSFCFKGIDSMFIGKQGASTTLKTLPFW